MKAAMIDDIAADWVARRDAGPLSPQADAALQRWLAQDPRHAGAFARAQAVFLHADRASALGPNFDPRDFPASGRSVSPRPLPLRRLALASAATVLLALGLGLVARYGMPFSPQDRYETAMGEVRRLPLDDGSVMTLNTASKVRVEMTGSMRLVRLSDGEALFDVAKDRSRPFVVDTGQVRVRAVGTSFTVRRLPDHGIEVTVREGLVSIELADDPSGRKHTPLGANMQAVFAPGRPPRIAPIASTEVDQRLTWRDGMIAFNGDTLAEAVAEFSRYSAVDIVIDDPRIAQMRVVGLYAANDPTGFAHAVAMSFGLESEALDGAVRLRLRDGSLME